MAHRHQIIAAGVFVPQGWLLRIHVAPRTSRYANRGKDPRRKKKNKKKGDEKNYGVYLCTHIARPPTPLPAGLIAQLGCRERGWPHYIDFEQQCCCRDTKHLSESPYRNTYTPIHTGDKLRGSPRNPRFHIHTAKRVPSPVSLKASENGTRNTYGKTRAALRTGGHLREHPPALFTAHPAIDDEKIYTNGERQQCGVVLHTDPATFALK